MATKTISIDVDAYRRLEAARREHESFSQVIKRKIRRPLDLDLWLKRLKESPADRGALKAVEEQVSGRRRRSRGSL